MDGSYNLALGSYSSITNSDVMHSVVIGSGALSDQTGAIILGGAGTNVGIGLSDPNYKLEVDGDINAIGTVHANGIALTSDARFKK